MNKIPKNFRGYAGAPESELDVAFLMGLVYDDLPFRLVVTSINDAFPDCEGIDPLTGKTVNIEFEVLSRNYKHHGHPEKGCDYIVCWRDNWPESPIPVISIEQLVKERGLLGKRFIFVPRPGSLLQQLEELRKRNVPAFETVSYLLNEALPKVSQIYPQIYIDDSLSKHFNVRDKNGLGIFGFYPHGKLVCVNVSEFVKRYGPDITDAAHAFRGKIIGIKLLASKEDADGVAEALREFLANSPLV